MSGQLGLDDIAPESPDRPRRCACPDERDPSVHPTPLLAHGVGRRLIVDSRISEFPAAVGRCLLVGVRFFPDGELHAVALDADGCDRLADDLRDRAQEIRTRVACGPHPGVDGPEQTHARGGETS